MNKAEFRDKTHREPRQDDLERVNCSKAGQVGHWGCGWCDIHDAPMFQCGCGVTRANRRPIIITYIA